MPAEIFAGLNAFKSMFDMAKALKDMNDVTVRNGAVIELQVQILAAYEAQTALLGRVGELEEKVRGFEKWEAEKYCYDLKDLGWSAFAYMLKPDARGTKPPHWVCTHCYNNGHAEIIQKKRTGSGFSCPRCHIEISPSASALTNGRPQWLD